MAENKVCTSLPLRFCVEEPGEKMRGVTDLPLVLAEITPQTSDSREAEYSYSVTS